jgi:hypothetical protein
VSLARQSKYRFCIQPAKLTAGRRRDTAPGSDSFDTAFPTAAAERPGRIRQRMAAMAGQASATGLQPALADDPPPTPVETVKKSISLTFSGSA